MSITMRNKTCFTACTITLMLSLISSRQSDTNFCTKNKACQCIHSGRSYEAKCSHEDLTQVPHFLNNVTKVDLSFNKISALFSNTSVPGSTLHIDVSHNILENLSRQFFENLKELVSLNMSHNKLAYTDSIFEHGVFNNLLNLEFINILGNNKDECVNNESTYVDYPDAISSLPNLRTLKLDALKGAMFDASYAQLSHLTNLTLSCGFLPKCKQVTNISEDWFKYTPYVQTLEISYCGYLNRINKGAFSEISTLASLNVSNNIHLTFHALYNITFGLIKTQIKVLDVSILHCTYGVGTTLFRSDLINLKYTNLTSVYLVSNRLTDIENGVLPNLPKSLENIIASDNHLTVDQFTIEVALIKNIKFIDVSKMNNHHIANDKTNRFTRCNDYRCKPSHEEDIGSDLAFTGHTVELNEQSLQIKSNTINYHDQLKTEKHESHFDKVQIFGDRFQIPFPKTLESLDCSYAYMTMEIPHLYIADENNLKSINLRGNIMYKWIGPISNFSKLVHLDLSSNFCSNISSVFFDGFPYLENLNISENLLGFVWEDDANGETFIRLKNLTELDMSSNRIRKLPWNIFQSQIALKHLSLRNNLLTKITFKISHMINLEVLDLSFNQLLVIDEDTCNALDFIGKEGIIPLQMDFNANNFICSCQHLTFMKWLHSNGHIMKTDTQTACRQSNDYTVSFSQLSTVIQEFEKTCPSYYGLIAGVFGGITFFLSILISGLVYRFRWKIRYTYYMFKGKISDDALRPNEKMMYEYDAFISYAEEDANFVTNDVLENLEMNRGMHLCIHQRDFTPGKNIATSITAAIHKSRKTIVILSQSFIRSHWCMFELNMAKMEAIYSREGLEEVLFIVFYENIPIAELPMPVVELVNKQSYIEYPHDEQGNIVFWTKVANTLVN